jgi:hypothetical protein
MTNVTISVSEIKSTVVRAKAALSENKNLFIRKLKLGHFGR